jgi:AraC-like DNA-binding protein
MGVLTGYLFPPLAYLYVRQNVRPGIHAKDMIHFLPALLYFIDFLPFYLLSAEEKVSVVSHLTGDHIDSLLAHREGWITPPWFHMVFRNAVTIFYCILSFRILWRLTYVKQSDFYKDNASVVKWLWTFAVFQFMIVAPYVIFVIMGKAQYTFYTTMVPLIIMVGVTNVALFFKPSVFYGFSGILFQSEKLSSENNKEFIDNESKKKDKSELELEYLKEEDVSQLKKSITSFLFTDQPYLMAGYSINDFSKDVGVPVRKLSAYVKNVENSNFRDFLNRQRVDYCVENLNSGEWQHLTLEAIAEQCGFNNRNSFTTAFKKFVGTNPSTFLNRLKRHEPI